MGRMQEQFQAAFDAFMQKDAEEAIMSSTRAGWNGSGYSVELFEDGRYRVLYNGDIGNLYVSPGIIIGIPQLADDEYNQDEPALSVFDNALEGLAERFATLEEYE